MEDYKKKYEELEKNIKRLYNSVNENWKITFEAYIPELKESEDEKIRKELIKGFQHYDKESKWGEFTTTEILDWLEKRDKKPQKTLIWKHWKNGIAGNGEGDLIYLVKIGNTYNLTSCLGSECDYIELSELDNLMFEKQGEQKPADKVEPRFKIEKGKWYVCIKDLLDNYANEAFCEGDIYLSTQDGSLIPSNSNVPFKITCPDTYFRDWAIQDAKDGDVLANEKMIVIFKHFEEPSHRQHIVAYVGLDTCGNIQITDETWILGINKAKPATKEQRDLLFQKMKEAGYEWDADEKELKKIDARKNLTLDGDLMQADCIIVEKKSAWSEEDERIYNEILDFFLGNIETRCATIDKQRHWGYWLKSLKERIKGGEK